MQNFFKRIFQFSSLNALKNKSIFMRFLWITSQKAWTIRLHQGASINRDSMFCEINS